MENKNLPKVRQELRLLESIIQITKTSDLLKAKPINEQILKYSRNEVGIMIAASINKCADALGIEMDDYRLQLLAEDIIEVYKWDSIEDIQICLRNGRQGKYGTTYNKLNMIVINDWMSEHLEEKAIAREHQYKEHKHDFKTREEYLQAVEIGLERDRKAKQEKEDAEKYLHDKNNEYAKYLAWYEKNKKPEGTIKEK